MRDSRNIRIILVFVLMTIFALAARPALAKGGWRYYDPECPIAVGPNTMKFVAMQPKVNIERVCDALAETGPAIIVLETRDGELRDMSWDIRILRDEGKTDGEESPNADAEFHLPVAKYKNGMVNFDVTFKNAGKYMLLVEATSDDGTKKYIGRHRFTAGLFETAEIYTFIGVGGLALAGAAVFFVWRRRRRERGVASAP